MSQDALLASCQAAMAASAGGPLSGLVAWIREQRAHLSKEMLLTVALGAYDLFAAINIPQIPDVLEAPAEAWLREKLVAYINGLYAS